MNPKLFDITKYAFYNVPFYMNYYEKNDINIDVLHGVNEWDKIPLLKKDDINNNPTNYYSIEYLMRIMNHQIEFMRTSGSTGKCLELYWDINDARRSLLPLWVYRKKYYDIDPSDTYCYFYTARKVGTEELEEETFHNRVGFCKMNLDHNKLAQIYKKMKTINPKCMYLQPSMAELLFRSAKKEGLGRIEGLSYIELTGETLFETERKELEEFFQCRISNQYGANEVNSIAFECSKGQLHCMGTNVYVEVLENGKPVRDGQEGDIHVTSFHNHAMPFIRYDIGDRGILYKNIECECGNKNPILKLKSGRKNDWILNKDGTKINTYIFIRAIDNVNTILESAIKQFQIIQDDYNDFLVKLVIDDEVDKEGIIKIFIDNVLQSSLSQSSYRFEFHRSLFPDNKTGKLKFFYNKING